LLAVAFVSDVARVVLGVVFLVSGVAKVAAGRRWAAQASELGVPAAVAGGLPWGEVALGAALVSGLTAPWPAVLAVVVLAAFTVWIVVSLARGEHPPCACFGALSVAPLSWRHVVRNVALLALAALAAVG
jgi:uncharacterized membrane protein YphA (DoxX/SURF4 family)